MMGSRPDAAQGVGLHIPAEWLARIQPAAAEDGRLVPAETAPAPLEMSADPERPVRVLDCFNVAMEVSLARHERLRAAAPIQQRPHSESRR